MVKKFPPQSWDCKFDLTSMVYFSFFWRGWVNMLVLCWLMMFIAILCLSKHEQEFTGVLLSDLPVFFYFFMSTLYFRSYKDKEIKCQTKYLGHYNWLNSFKMVPQQAAIKWLKLVKEKLKEDNKGSSLEVSNM